MCESANKTLQSQTLDVIKIKRKTMLEIIQTFVAKWQKGLPSNSIQACSKGYILLMQLIAAVISW